MLKYSKPAVESTSISATGMGYSSLGVAALRSRKSMHTRKEPFFLITGTILAIHSTYLVVWMNLQRRSLSTSALIFEWISGANLLGVCLIGHRIFFESQRLFVINCIQFLGKFFLCGACHL